MTLLTLIRIVFLLSLGVYLISIWRPLPVVAGVASFILGLYVLLGRF